MPNPFKDWARMYGANKQYLESQGRPSSFLGQIVDIPNRIHEAADASEIGMKMMRHAQMHIARMQPGATIAVFVDPQNPVDMAIDWIRTGSLGPPPPGSTPGPGEPGRARRSGPDHALDQPTGSDRPRAEFPSPTADSGSAVELAVGTNGARM
jgi:hypothetical protein